MKTSDASPFHGCECFPDKGWADHDCPDDAFASATIIPKQPGSCFDLLSFCFEGDPCIYEVSLIYTTSDPSAILTLYVNGNPRISAGGPTMSVAPFTVTVPCNDQASVAIGSHDNICVEALMDCKQCPAKL